MLELGTKVWLKIRHIQVGGEKDDYVVVKYEFASESDHRNSWFSKLKSCNYLSSWFARGYAVVVSYPYTIQTPQKGLIIPITTENGG